MLDPAVDIAAILADCGGVARLENGELLGRLIEEPVQLELQSGQLVESSEVVFYASAADVKATNLVRDDWLEVDSKRWFVRKIPPADSAGVIRIVLKR